MGLSTVNSHGNFEGYENMRPVFGDLVSVLFSRIGELLRHRRVALLPPVQSQEG